MERVPTTDELGLVAVEHALVLGPDLDPRHPAVLGQRPDRGVEPRQRGLVPREQLRCGERRDDLRGEGAGVLLRALQPLVPGHALGEHRGETRHEGGADEAEHQVLDQCATGDPVRPAPVG